MKSRAYAMLGSKRRIVPTCRTSPEAVTAEASASHSSTLTPIGVADVLAFRLPEELAGVLRLNALRLGDRAGRRRVVLGPAQLRGRQAAGRRVRPAAGSRRRRLPAARRLTAPTTPTRDRRPATLTAARTSSAPRRTAEPRSFHYCRSPRRHPRRPEHDNLTRRRAAATNDRWIEVKRGDGLADA